MTINRKTEDRESSPPPGETLDTADSTDSTDEVQPDPQPDQQDQDILDQDEEDEDEDEQYVSPEEYQQLDSQLDDLNLVLDMMEQKNDRIRAEFLKLLHSNKQIREELQQENQNVDSNEPMEE